MKYLVFLLLVGCGSSLDPVTPIMTREMTDKRKIALLKAELDSVKSERDFYKDAFNTVSKSCHEEIQRLRDEYLFNNTLTGE